MPRKLDSLEDRRVVYDDPEPQERLSIVHRRDLGTTDPHNACGGALRNDPVVKILAAFPFSESFTYLGHELYLDVGNVKSWYENIQEDKAAPDCLDGVDVCSVCFAEPAAWRAPRGFHIASSVGRGDGIRGWLNGQPVEQTQFKMGKGCSRQAFLLVMQYENEHRKEQLLESVN